MLIDTHSHIYLNEFDDDRTEVIKRAIQNNIRTILLPNIDKNSINPMMQLANTYPKICLPMMGMHPTSVNENFKKELVLIEEWLTKEKFYGIGETGIDLYWDKKYTAEQIKSFSIQIGWAKKYNLPIVIHVRESFNEVFNILDNLNDEKLNGVFHCFTGTLQQAEKIISYGFKIGIGGVLTFKNSKLDETVKNIDLKHIILETDSPYLTPAPNRGKRNESSFMIYTAQKLAEVKNETLEKVTEITTENAINLFKLT
ncbi:MAG: TatD family hydrolase [Chlorobi bacterium]|nr:TatD family hydrolase [Chlorobiota bacterium]